MNTASHEVYILRHCEATGASPADPLTPLGRKHAGALLDLLCDANIGRIVSSPFVRAYQSVQPLAEFCGIPVEIDARLAERILSPIPLENWRDRLAETFVDLDRCFEGGESSNAAMVRGTAVVSEVCRTSETTVALVTHGNLMTLVLKSFDDRIGYADWERLRIPDVYRLTMSDGATRMERLAVAGSITIDSNPDRSY